MRREIEHRLSFFETWLRNQRYSEKTIVTYVKAIKVFFLFFDSKLPEQITISDFHSFNKDFIIKQGYSASYQNQVINAIKLFYLKIEQRELNIELIERPRKYRPLPKVIPKEVIQRMLSSIPNLKHKTALTLIYSCGLRRGELINLKLSHLDSKRRTLSVINGKGQKDRVVLNPNNRVFFKFISIITIGDALSGAFCPCRLANPERLLVCFRFG